LDQKSRLYPFDMLFVEMAGRQRQVRYRLIRRLISYGMFHFYQSGKRLGKESRRL